MARLFTGYISEDDCIGDSLGPTGGGSKSTINANSLALDQAVQSLSAGIIATNNSFTNQLLAQNTNLASLSSQVNAAPASNSVLRAYCHTFNNESVRTLDLKNYAAAPGSSITVTSTRNNSRFIVTVSGVGYTMPGTTGANLGISRTVVATTTRVLGIDGVNGDAWMGTANGHTGSFSITRTALDAPNQPAGTTITYTMLHGHWTAGTSYINYNQAAYQAFSSVTVYEIV